MNAADSRYFTDVGEHEYIMFRLEQMLKAERSRSALDRMIDQSTGFDGVKMAEAKSLIRRARTLRRRIMKHEEGAP